MLLQEATEEIVKALKNFDASVVLLVDRYAPMDFTQLVRDHAEEHPEIVMETPQVTAAAYGAAAEIHGLNVAFASMSGGSIAMLLLAIFVVKGKRRTVKISV